MQTKISTRPAHMFLASDGALHDTRRSDWAANPLRAGFSFHHSRISNARELCACLRAGEYAWPGGYRLAFVTSDGGALSFAAVRENLFSAVYSIRNEVNDGWRVVGLVDVDNSDAETFCSHTGECLGGSEEAE